MAGDWNELSIEHALQCCKGGFVTLHHNHIRNTKANLLTEVFKDNRIEPQLQPLSGEKFSEIINQIKLELNIVQGFWLTGQVAFFDIRVFNPTAKRYINQERHISYRVNEKEKKKQYI